MAEDLFTGSVEHQPIVIERRPGGPAFPAVYTLHCVCGWDDQIAGRLRAYASKRTVERSPWPQSHVMDYERQAQYTDPNPWARYAVQGQKPFTADDIEEIPE